MYFSSTTKSNDFSIFLKQNSFEVLFYMQFLIMVSCIFVDPHKHNYKKV